MLFALLWAPFSFLLHNVIHEGAHALITVVYGGRVTAFFPFPSKRTGYFTWAYVATTPLTRGVALMLAAPVLAELLWLALFLSLSFVTDGVLQKILLVEVVSSNVDIVVWLLGWWSPRPNPYCDAERFRKTLNFSRGLGKALSLAFLPIALVCGYALYRGYGFAT
jgi:hypothetical protein